MIHTRNSHRQVIPKMTSFCHSGMLRGSLGSELGVGIKITPLSLTSWTSPLMFFGALSRVVVTIDSMCSTAGPLESFILVRSSACRALSTLDGGWGRRVLGTIVVAGLLNHPLLQGSKRRLRSWKCETEIWRSLSINSPEEEDSHLMPYMLSL